jgi:hypothetical protein
LGRNGILHPTLPQRAWVVKAKIPSSSTKPWGPLMTGTQARLSFPYRPTSGRPVYSEAGAGRALTLGVIDQMFENSECGTLYSLLQSHSLPRKYRARCGVPVQQRCDKTPSEIG